MSTLTIHLANFKVKLGRPIQLTGHYEVGLVEIIYPNKSLNVQEKEAGIVIKTEKRETVNIPSLPVNKAGKRPKSAKDDATAEDKKKANQKMKTWKEKKQQYDRMMREYKNALRPKLGDEVLKKIIKTKRAPAQYLIVTPGTKSVELQPGVYSNVHQLAKALKSEMEEINVELDEKTGLFTVLLHGDVKSAWLSPRMAELLGYPSTEKGYTISKSEKASLLPQLEGSAHSLYVYSSVVENQLVGDTVAPLLRVVCPAANQMGEKVTEKYIRPYYVPVNTNYIDTVDIQIRTTTGQLLSVS